MLERLLFSTIPAFSVTHAIRESNAGVVFFEGAFRRKIYRSMLQLQTDVDQWSATYNEQRPHSGPHCFGKTLMQAHQEVQ